MLFEGFCTFLTSEIHEKKTLYYIWNRCVFARSCPVTNGDVMKSRWKLSFPSFSCYRDFVVVEPRWGKFKNKKMSPHSWTNKWEIYRPTDQILIIKITTFGNYLSPICPHPENYTFPWKVEDYDSIQFLFWWDQIGNIFWN